MTRDTYDVTIRRASQLSHKLDLFTSSPAPVRRPSKAGTLMAKRSLIREDFRGSDRTLVSSSHDSNNSSRSNVNTFASSSYYTNSNTDIRDGDDRTDDEDDDGDEESQEKPEELEADKGLWEKRYHYVLLGFGAVFGIRNVLEFPALALEHGGGAFIFTYVILTFTIGLPIVYLEVSLGQYARGGVVKAWRILPLARGIGVCSLLLTLAVASYAITPAAWALYYIYSAVSGLLPFQNISSQDQASSLGETANQTSRASSNLTAFFYRHRTSYNISCSYFYLTTLEKTASISTMGHVVSHIVICLIIVWFIVFILSAIGPRLMGKISFCFTAIPSLLLVVLFIAACTMSGSVLGIQTFLNPRWQHLSTFKPWLDALDLVLSGLACGTGVLITLSGHCHFHGNTFKNAMSFVVLSLTMTIICGCLMLSLLGVESGLAGVHVDNITKTSDFELGFVLFPTVTSTLPLPAFWSGLFFSSLVLFSLVNAAVMAHHLQQGVIDMVYLEDIRRHWKIAILGVLVVIMTSLNVLTTAQNGLHVLRLLQLSVPRLTTPLLCAAQCVTVGWSYGGRRFAGRVMEMTGKNKSFIWKWSWRWGCPVLLSLIAVVSLLKTNLLQDLPAVDMNKRWLHGIGWSLNPAILCPGIIMAAVSFFKVPGTFKQRLKQLRSTPSTWGPGHPEHEPQADLPDYVICHPDPFRPANALAMLTANLYLPNIVNFVNMQSSGPETEMAPGYLSDVATLASSDDESLVDAPPSKDSFFGRCHATINCLSHVIGLGNVVRFPYLAYRHGGGAFVIAYVIVLITCGLPLVVIETAIGQFSSLGPISIWRAVPIFKGVGYTMVVISLATSVYYSVITSWCVFYLATALTSVMPWQDCQNSWNTNSCRTIDTTIDICHTINITNLTAANQCLNGDSSQCHVANQSKTSHCNDVGIANSNRSSNGSMMSSTDEYFYLSVVKISEGWHEVGELRWQLALCLLTTWVVVSLFLIKAFRPGGKTTYLILTVTGITLLILLIRSSSLVGGNDGLSYLFTFQWSKIANGHVWRDAASQVFFSLSLGSGTLVTMGTYNKFTNNVFREAALLCFLDSSVSLLCSLVVFAIIGALAHATGMEKGSVENADLGLSFVTLSHAVLQLPWPLFWAILTFLMLVLCGVFTCVATMSTAVTSLMDLFSSSLKKQRVWLVLALCTGGATLGLTMMVQVGFFVVDVLDTHLSGLPQLCVGLCFTTGFVWIYGIRRFCGDVSRMINDTVGWWWRLIWLIVSPSLMATLLVSALASVIVGDEQLSHPWWATALGVVLWFLEILPILVGVVHEVSQARTTGGLIEKVHKACQARKEWGATLHRCHSNVEYYPTVHTTVGLDISGDGLNTVTDHVEFTTVGVRVPSLSQTTLLPVSPGISRGKKPMDMRHKAILNHAYSNPQCNTSSGSLEKLGKRKQMSVSNDELNDVIVVMKPKKNVVTCDVGTQTDHTMVENKLCRQRSQPTVHVTKPVPLMTRSSSWHQLGGQPAVLKVNTRQLKSCNRSKVSLTQSRLAKKSPRQRRYGQSIAPNLGLLMADNEKISSGEDSEDALISPASGSDGTRVKSLGRGNNSGSSDSLSLRSRSNSNNFRPRLIKANTIDASDMMEDGMKEASSKSMISREGDPRMTKPHNFSTSRFVGDIRNNTTLNSPAHSSIYSRRRARMRDLGLGVKVSRSKSVEEAFEAMDRDSTEIAQRNLLPTLPKDSSLRLQRNANGQEPVRGIDNLSCRVLTRSDSDNAGVIRKTICNNSAKKRCVSHPQAMDFVNMKGLNRNKSSGTRGGNVIMEEEDGDSELCGENASEGAAYLTVDTATEIRKL